MLPVTVKLPARTFPVNDALLPVIVGPMPITNGVL